MFCLKLGVCKEETLPYSKMGPGLPAIPPGTNDEAKHFKIGAYARVQTLCNRSSVLENFWPIIFHRTIVLV